MHYLEIAGWASTGLALVGVWLNNKQCRACFALWLVSNAITCSVHVAYDVWSLASRDIAFFVLAIHGWWLWSAKRPAARANGVREDDSAPAAFRKSVEPLD